MAAPFPKPLAGDGFSWRTLKLTPEQVLRKEEAIRFYKSQTVDSLSWMGAFVRSNELFAVSEEVKLTRQGWSVSHGLVARPETQAYERERFGGHVEGVAFRESSEGLLVRIVLRQPLERELGFSVYAFGYRDDQPFCAMPKIHASFTLGWLRLTDQGTPVPKHPVRIEMKGKEAIVSFPWSFLGDPQILFVQTQGRVSGVPVSQTSWRILHRRERSSP